MAMHKISREDIDTEREVQTLREQIQALREQLHVVSESQKERIRDLIELRTSRLREIQR